ncbi:glycosyltransferase family 2 protein [Agrobacterium genomosp. 3 str. CIP 111-78]|uniref:Glycosyltransferase family 2 protein n=1 Tax=Agrobacterium tumefaciens TaxID=358 RepID=A0AAE6BPU7_AGRTU|nr:MULTISPECIES: glycosyltransferase family A protein [Agrobacterium tumefaciens complex]MCA2372171.1 glycosyltransferase family 2 protein [Agrobacterium tomkonis CIP 111-78]QCM02078.1 glycosyltransferase family 2 protein [Agrobacterium tumefaciens]
MNISLVTSTMHRPRQIGELLESLKIQSVQATQIIVVDQSSDDGTEEVVKRFEGSLPVLYIRDSRKGLSRGRNLGLEHVTGDIVAFPDDDCIYLTDTLKRVSSAFLDDGDLGVYTGMSITPAGVPSQGRWGMVPHVINRFNIWTSQTSYTTFYRVPTLKKAGRFNEDLGVGSGTVWGAGEETELLLRALRDGAKGFYDPGLRIMHPEPLAIFDDVAMKRGRLYNRGFGRVMRMEAYPLWFITYMAGRPLIGAMAALAKGQLGQARYRASAFRERLRGWADDPNRQTQRNH